MCRLTGPDRQIYVQKHFGLARSGPERQISWLTSPNVLHSFSHLLLTEQDSIREKNLVKITIWCLHYYHILGYRNISQVKSKRQQQKNPSEHILWMGKKPISHPWSFVVCWYFNTSDDTTYKHPNYSQETVHSHPNNSQESKLHDHNNTFKYTIKKKILLRRSSGHFHPSPLHSDEHFPVH